MTHLNITATSQSPAVYFDETLRTLNITGECYPENITKFSSPIFQWLDEYLTSLQKQTFTLNIELVYFNSSSSKMLLDLFDRLQEEVINKQKNIIVNWIYDVENESAFEHGEEFKEDLTHLIFNLLKKS
jgi:hypothetical protein